MDNVEIRLRNVIINGGRLNIDLSVAEKLFEKTDCDLKKDFGYDSLLMVKLVVDLEMEFDIEIDLEEINTNMLSSYSFLRDTISKFIEE